MFCNTIRIMTIAVVICTPVLVGDGDSQEVAAPVGQCMSTLRDFGPFGDPIATRELTSGVTGDRVIVDIGIPRPYPENGMWVCPYRITGIEAEPTAGSIAGVEALQGCVSVIGDVLASTGHPVTFYGDEPGFRRLIDPDPT